MAENEKDVHLEISLRAGEVRFDTFEETIHEIDDALKDIERQLTGKSPRVQWKWVDEPVIRAVASPNGVPTETLNEIVSKARLGFERIAQATSGDIEWPAGIGARAKRALRKVVRTLKVVDAITVDTSTGPPLLIEQVTLKETLGRPRPPREVTSIDGILELISVRGHPHVSVEEHGTGRRIRCTLPDDLLEKAKSALGQRVVIEGVTYFTPAGEPSLLTEVSDLWIRPNETRRLERLRGSAPDFTEGQAAEDYVRDIRGHRNGDDGGRD
jgi:hypothetical protein